MSSRILANGFRLVAMLAAALPLLWAPARAEEVDLQLILMVDASGSIDRDEHVLQRMGYVQAFRDPRVIRTIRRGPLGRIAIAYVEWTGAALQAPIASWTLLSDEASVRAFADRLERTPRMLFSGGTAVGHAILYGAAAIKASGHTGGRRVIDVSGDGRTNRGVPAEFARDEAVAQGFAINGLPILAEEPELDEYYRENVIGGPGAFMIPARRFEDFAAAILNKLVREIAGTDEPEDMMASAGRGAIVTGR